MKLLNTFWFVLALSPLASTEVAKGNDKPPGLLDATLDQLRHGLDTGLFTSVDLAKAYIARIHEVNGDLHAVNEINPDALAIAATMDGERKKAYGQHLPPLHGIPVIVKDNIATHDKMNNTAGSYALVGAKVSQDSTVAAKLRKAGAIILGKSNLSQWANWRSVNTTNGWSAYGGQTVGAYFPGQDPSGSSSGSGVSSSIGLAWACLGSETDGSIISPSENNNVVGIKPTVGLTSRFLVVPISEHQDSVGPLARTVKDAAHLLAAIAGKDKNDNYTSAIPWSDDKAPDYVGACKESGLQGKRIGVPRNLFPNDNSPVSRSFNSTLAVLRAGGAKVIDNLHLPGADVLGNSNFETVVLDVDFVTDLPKLYLSHLTTNPHNITNVEQLQEFTQHFPKEDYPHRDTGLWQDGLDYGYDNTSPQFWGNYSSEVYYAGEKGVLGALKQYKLDALIVPSAYASSLPAQFGGPVVTVPMGRTPDNTPTSLNSFGTLNVTGPNQPFGLGFMGAKFSEETLIQIAYAYEQRTMVREKVHPQVKPKTELQDVVGK